jgi:hypothetical protein
MTVSWRAVLRKRGPCTPIAATLLILGRAAQIQAQMNSVDLETGTAEQYNFITPNLCNDMHDTCASVNTQISQGDTWLAKEVPQILSSTAYLNGGALSIVWDEGSSGSDGPLPMIWVSPFGRTNGYSNFIYSTHGSRR